MKFENDLVFEIILRTENMYHIVYALTGHFKASVQLRSDFDYSPSKWPFFQDFHQFWTFLVQIVLGCPRKKGFSRDWGEEWCPWRRPSHRCQLVWGAWWLQLDLVLASLVVVDMVARQHLHLPLIVGTKVVGKDGVWRRRAFARVPRVSRCAWAGALAWVEITWKFTGCWNWENLPTICVKNKVPASMGCVSWADDSLSGSWPAACPQVPAVPSLSAQVPAVPSWPPRIWRTRSTRATWSWYWSKALSSSRMCWVLNQYCWSGTLSRWWEKFLPRLCWREASQEPPGRGSPLCSQDLDKGDWSQGRKILLW